MLTLSALQIDAFRRSREEATERRLRAAARAIGEHRRLAEADAHWHPWWHHVCMTGVAVHVQTLKRLATHATLSLWFGHRYFDDARYPWLRDLLATVEGGLDYRILEVSPDTVIEVAAEEMALNVGAHGETLTSALIKLEDIAGKIARGEEPAWTATIARRLLHSLYAERMGALVNGDAWLVEGVERTSALFSHGGSVRYPLLLSIFYFGVDPWRDPALPELWSHSRDFVTLPPKQMWLCLQRQARFSLGTDPRTAR